MNLFIVETTNVARAAIEIDCGEASMKGLVQSHDKTVTLFVGTTGTVPT